MARIVHLQKRVKARIYRVSHVHIANVLPAPRGRHCILCSTWLHLPMVQELL